MRLSPIPYMDSNDREKLKPKVGDTVIYEGTHYVVEQVGLKYVSMHLLSNPAIKGFVKMSEVYKYFEPEPEAEYQPLKKLIENGAT